VAHFLLVFRLKYCKVKLSLCLTNYAPRDTEVWGSEGIDPAFFTSVLDGGGQLYAPATLRQGKQPRYQLDRRLREPQSRSGRCGVEEKSLALARNRTPIVPARRYTELSQLALKILCA
jgi:hypothetical protein